jgi:ABC-2 type transport system permease protein
MSIISLIIKREYLSRVKKKSFIVMTILGPVLMAALMVAPVLIASYDQDDVQKIQVIDESKLFIDKLTDSESMNFQFDTIPVQDAKASFDGVKFDALLYIPGNVLTNTTTIMLFSADQPNLSLVTSIEKSLQQEIENMKLRARGIDRKTLSEIKTDVSVNTRKLTEKGEEQSSAGLSTAVGMIGGILIYMFIFLYGAQVMRGVIEEKTNRIVEVIISSVKPFQLMMGKIVGIALVGLTQFVLWIVLTLTISSVATTLFLDDKLMQEQMMQQRTPIGTMVDKEQVEEEFGGGEISQLMSAVDSVNFPLLIGAFLFFFVGGYLLYGALFAAIGAAVDNEADTQQFMLPITIPLILSFVVSQSIIQNPGSPMAFWFSIIPFTSPVVMMVRLPFGVPMWEMALSMGLLVVGFVLTTWLAGRIYRTGILMYGKKPSWKELGKWLFYKE